MWVNGVHGNVQSLLLWLDMNLFVWFLIISLLLTYMYIHATYTTWKRKKYFKLNVEDVQNVNWIYTECMYVFAHTGICASPCCMLKKKKKWYSYAYMHMTNCY